MRHQVHACWSLGSLGSLQESPACHPGWRTGSERHCCVTLAGLWLLRGSTLSLRLPSWAGADQIVRLPFIALSLIGITLCEEIAPPRHSQPEGSAGSPVPVHP